MENDENRSPFDGRTWEDIGENAMEKIQMDVDSLEKLIDTISENTDIKELCEEIAKIIGGKESSKNLLAFVPKLVRIAYQLVEKDGTRGDEIEKMVKVVIVLLESKMA